MARVLLQVEVADEDRPVLEAAVGGEGDFAVGGEVVAVERLVAVGQETTHG